MGENGHLVNLATGYKLARKVIHRRSAWERALGLMFRREIAKDEALIFYLPRPGVREASVHTQFVPFPIALFWLDERRRVVDKTLAQPWHKGYRPTKPAHYFIEIHSVHFYQVFRGDRLDWGGDDAQEAG